LARSQTYRFAEIAKSVGAEQGHERRRDRAKLAQRNASLRRTAAEARQRSVRSAHAWKAQSAELSLVTGKIPGSGGRPAYLAALIVREYNKRLSAQRRLVSPTRVVIE
jgi:hypothetical protein